MATIWRTFTAICLAAIAWGVSAEEVRSGQAELPDPVSAHSLGACVDKLDQQGGGWCSLGGSFFKSGASPESLDYYSSIRGWTGAKSIFIAWNGMAFDAGQKKLYLLANGGHADYLGNGVYEFDLSRGKWTRLKDPCRLSYEVEKGEQAPYGGISRNKKAESVYIPGRGLADIGGAGGRLVALRCQHGQGGQVRSRPAGANHDPGRGHG